VLAVLLTLTVGLLGGCANLARPLAEHLLLPEEVWAKAQKNINVQAIVEHDEEYDYSKTGSVENASGAGPAERRYRRVGPFMTHSEGSKPTLGFKGYLRFL